MILVTLGTQDKDFSRLLKAIDKQIENGNIKDKVIVQAGYTKYESKNMEIFDLIDKNEFDKLIKKCDILITHGGVGCILEGLKNSKKIIAASRLKKYGEHTNDHQKQIVGEFKKQGYILELRDFNKLDEVLKDLKKFKPKKYESNNKKFVSIIDNYIKKDSHTSWFNRYRYLIKNGYRGVILSLINVFVFCLLFSKISVYSNIIISFFITLLFELVFILLMDIKINKSLIKYSFIKVISLLLDLSFIYVFTSIFNNNIIYSKFITDLLIMIFTILIIFCFRREEV